VKIGTQKASPSILLRFIVLGCTCCREILGESTTYLTPEQLERLKQRRKGHCGVVTRFTNEATLLCEGERDEMFAKHRQIVNRKAQGIERLR